MAASNWLVILVWGGPFFVGVPIFLWQEFRRSGMGIVASTLALLGVFLPSVLIIVLGMTRTKKLMMGACNLDYCGLAINVVLMVIGAALGVWLGMLNQTRLNRIAEERARETLKKRLRDTIQFNIDRLNDIAARLTPDSGGNLNIPNFPLDTTHLSQVMFSGRNLFNDEDEYRHLDWYRYQIEHINNKLDILGSLQRNAPNFSVISYQSEIMHVAKLITWLNGFRVQKAWPKPINWLGYRSHD